ncbi:MAG TPA: FCD domain-containing protein [Acidimicrobiales bacterium]|nr:FCD domain-containing protein [Acidimicrobiales bacterium]
MTINSAARQAADLLAEDILAHEGDEEEWPLGSEDELMKILGVGRPTIRQAARLLEQQQLVVVRRGINGGIFGRRPSGAGVTAAARVFLQSEQTTFRQLLQAELVVGPAAAALAAEHADVEGRQGLLTFWSSTTAKGAAVSARQFMELAPTFQREVARLSGSPVVFLFVGVLMDLAAPSAGIADVYGDPERRALTIERHTKIAQAIHGGQGSLAERRMSQHLKWILETVDPRSLDEPLGLRQR